MTFMYFGASCISNPVTTIPVVLSKARYIYLGFPKFTFGKSCYPTIIPSMCCGFKYHICLFQLSEKNSKFKAEKEKGLFIISDLTYA